MNETFGVNEQPGKGIYRCLEYPQWVVSLEYDFEPLPPCFGESRFQNVQYHRVVDLSTSLTLRDVQEV